jgi:DNA-directed RNA polymerase specialized sigma24 family protein
MLRAFSHLKDFQEKCFSTWLTRIAINSALMILRKKRGCYEIPFEGIDDSGNNYERWEVKSPAENSESRLARKERGRVAESCNSPVAAVIKGSRRASASKRIFH